MNGLTYENYSLSIQTQNIGTTCQHSSSQIRI